MKLMSFYQKSPQQALEVLEATTAGLTNSQAKHRLETYGLNAIIVQGEPLWRRLIEPFANLMMGVLAIAVVISLMHHALFDAVVILAIMLVSATIFYVQRFSTERILKSLQQKSSVKVDVLRDGKVVQLPAEKLVPGDIILIDEGEKIPADARLISSSSLRIDESQITGESMPVDKSTDTLDGEQEIYDQACMVFQGSFVVSGEATAVVVATGNKTEFGKLAELSSHGSDKSPVQHKIDRLLQQIITVVAAIAVVAFSLAVYRGMEVVESLRFVIALAVSAVPESLPVAISVILALGMRRMAAKKALVRTMNSIETIGTVTTIASDKTGTLTINKLTAQDSWHPELSSAQFKRLVQHAINVRSAKLHDPLDTAMQVYTDYDHTKHKPMISFPFDQSVAMSGNIWHNGEIYHLYLKGAPEKILEHSDLTSGEFERAQIELARMTASGYRVIAVAHMQLRQPIDKLSDLTRKSRLEFAGFLAVADVLRSEAKSAIQTALRAGVTVRMITGDHFETAYQIGKQLGLVTTREQVFDSRDMHHLNEQQLEKIVAKTLVFSRVIPEHKHRLLSILKKNNITAMTGDGVNDVPALTNAHVGLAMGSGTQIAKDAGDIILVDDNFKSIVDAIHEGRTIYANIKRMLYYLMATSTGEVLTTVGALIIGLPVPLVPVQILWINLVTDTALVIPLGLEPGEKRNMLRPPQNSNAPILSRFMISRMVIVATTMAITALGLYAHYSNLYGHGYGSTIAFNALVVMQWASALCARSDYEPLVRRIFRLNIAFVIGLTAAITMQLLAIFGPLGAFLHVSTVGLGDLFVTSLVAFFALIIVAESHKLFGRFFLGKGSRPLR